MPDNLELRVIELETTDKLLIQRFEYFGDELKEIKEGVRSIKHDIQFEKLAQKFVTIDRFKNIERLVYGMVGLVLVSFITYLINLVFNGQGSV